VVNVLTKKGVNENPRDLPAGHDAQNRCAEIKVCIEPRAITQTSHEKPKDTLRSGH
jgi:hypothetical protein